MTEEKEPHVMAIDAHEEFVQHIEEGGGRMATLALVTMAVSGLLAGSYVSQLLVVPYFMNIRYQTVDLLDPSLVALEVFLLALTLAWMYTGLREYLFAKRMVKRAKEIRTLETQAAAKYGLVDSNQSG
jgi:hypothetical protein